VGFHSITFEIHDDHGGSLPKTFIVEVYNEPPYFTKMPLPAYKVALNNVLKINITEFADKEGNEVIM
jgi:hypothetical protein